LPVGAPDRQSGSSFVEKGSRQMFRKNSEADKRLISFNGDLGKLKESTVELVLGKVTSI
jgi:hypothetical protein